jgi:hypothetical protein
MAHARSFIDVRVPFEDSDDANRQNKGVARMRDEVNIWGEGGDELEIVIVDDMDIRFASRTLGCQVHLPQRQPGQHIQDQLYKSYKVRSEDSIRISTRIHLAGRLRRRTALAIFKTRNTPYVNYTSSHHSYHPHE